MRNHERRGETRLFNASGIIGFRAAVWFYARFVFAKESARTSTLLNELSQILQATAKTRYLPPESDEPSGDDPRRFVWFSPEKRALFVSLGTLKWLQVSADRLRPQKPFGKHLAAFHGAASRDQMAVDFRRWVTEGTVRLADLTIGYRGVAEAAGGGLTSEDELEWCGPLQIGYNDSCRRGWFCLGFGDPTLEPREFATDVPRPEDYAKVLFEGQDQPVAKRRPQRLGEILATQRSPSVKRLGAVLAASAERPMRLACANAFTAQYRDRKVLRTAGEAVEELECDAVLEELLGEQNGPWVASIIGRHRSGRSSVGQRLIDLALKVPEGRLVPLPVDRQEMLSTSNEESIITRRLRTLLGSKEDAARAETIVGKQGRAWLAIVDSEIPVWDEDRAESERRMKALAREVRDGAVIAVGMVAPDSRTLIVTTPLGEAERAEVSRQWLGPGAEAFEGVCQDAKVRGALESIGDWIVAAATWRRKRRKGVTDFALIAAVMHGIFQEADRKGLPEHLPTAVRALGQRLVEWLALGMSAALHEPTAVGIEGMLDAALFFGAEMPRWSLERAARALGGELERETLAIGEEATTIAEKAIRALAAGTGLLAIDDGTVRWERSYWAFAGAAMGAARRFHQVEGEGIQYLDGLLPREREDLLLAWQARNSPCAVAVNHLWKDDETRAVVLAAAKRGFEIPAAVKREYREIVSEELRQSSVRKEMRSLMFGLPLVLELIESVDESILSDASLDGVARDDTLTSTYPRIVAVAALARRRKVELLAGITGAEALPVWLRLCAAAFWASQDEAALVALEDLEGRAEAVEWLEGVACDLKETLQDPERLYRRVTVDVALDIEIVAADLPEIRRDLVRIRERLGDSDGLVVTAENAKMTADAFGEWAKDLLRSERVADVSSGEVAELGSAIMKAWQESGALELTERAWLERLLQRAVVAYLGATSNTGVGVELVGMLGELRGTGVLRDMLGAVSVPTRVRLEAGRELIALGEDASASLALAERILEDANGNERARRVAAQIMEQATTRQPSRRTP